MVSLQPKAHDPYAALRVPEFRYWMAAAAFSSLAGRALTVAIGYQVYTLTKSPLALGMLGLVQAIPAVGLSLFGGHLADRYDRRTIVLITRAISVLAALGFALVSRDVQGSGLAALYAIVFVAGIARGFADPASSAFEAQVVPRVLYVNASSWSGSVYEVTAIAGPTLGGLFYAAFGATYTYLLVALFYALAWIFMALIKRKPMPPAQRRRVGVGEHRRGRPLRLPPPGAAGLDGAGPVCRALWRRRGAAAHLCQRYSARGPCGARAAGGGPVGGGAGQHAVGHAPPAGAQRRPHAAGRRGGLWGGDDHLCLVHDHVAVAAHAGDGRHV